MNYISEYNTIASALEQILLRYNVTLGNMQYYNNFSTNDKTEILRLLELKYKIQREEILYYHQNFHNIILLSEYRRKKHLTLVR